MRVLIEKDYHLIEKTSMTSDTEHPKQVETSSAQNTHEESIGGSVCGEASN